MNSMAPGILFVDDEGQSRKYFHKAFSKDFKILTASSVSEAKGILREYGSEIGVLVTDMQMPEENGVILLDHAKNFYPHIVRLLTTGYSDLEDAIAAVNSGEIIRYIEKPWDLSALHVELRSALSYYQLQSERDHLLGEKLSVKQRMMGINLARDLLVMGESFSHLQNSALGIRSLLLQVKVDSELDTSEKSLEMWGLFEDTLVNSLSMAKTIRERTLSYCSSQTQIISVNDMVQYAFEPMAENTKFELISRNNLPMLSLQTKLVRQLFCTLVKLFRDEIDDEVASISIVAEAKEDHIVLSLQPTTDKKFQRDEYKVNNKLIEIFLIAAHHQGDVELHGTDFGMDIKLPIEGSSVLMEESDTSWFEEIASLYED